MGRLTHIDGIPVADATEPVIVSVQPRDVRGAKKKKPATCAVARACMRLFDVKDVRIHLSRTYLRIGDQVWLRYATPPKARSEIVAFDRGGAFEPLEFRLVPVVERERLGAPHRGGTNSGTMGKRRGYNVAIGVRPGPKG